MTVTAGKLHDSKEFFHKYGIQTESPQPWEDGMRLSKELKPGQWEWWYTDGHFTNGLFFVASLHIIAMGNLLCPLWRDHFCRSAYRGKHITAKGHSTLENMDFFGRQK